VTISGRQRSAARNDSDTPLSSSTVRCGHTDDPVGNAPAWLAPWGGMVLGYQNVSGWRAGSSYGGL